MIDLLLRLISKNVDKRPTAQEALQHNFFRNISEGIMTSIKMVNDINPTHFDDDQ